MHIQMSPRSIRSNRVVLRIAAPNEAEFDIVIVGYDYPSGLSILCGLLSAFGLDIRTGEIYSFSKGSVEGFAGTHRGRS